MNNNNNNLTEKLYDNITKLYLGNDHVHHLII